MNNYKIFFLPSNAAYDAPELLTELKRYGEVVHAGKSEQDNRRLLQDLAEWQDAQTNNVSLIVVVPPASGRMNASARVGKGIHSTLLLDEDEESAVLFAYKSMSKGWILLATTDGFQLSRQADWKLDYARYPVEPCCDGATLADYFHDANPPTVCPTPAPEPSAGHNSSAPTIQLGAAAHHLNQQQQ